MTIDELVAMLTDPMGQPDTKLQLAGEANYTVLDAGVFISDSADDSIVSVELYDGVIRPFFLQFKINVKDLDDTTRDQLLAILRVAVAAGPEKRKKRK